MPVTKSAKPKKKPSLLWNNREYVGKLMRVNSGVSAKTSKRIIQLVLVSPTTKLPKAINIAASRRDEIVAELVALTEAVRKIPSDTE